jgi:hypothetical protein
MLGDEEDESLHQSIELLLEVLEITHITGSSEHGMASKRMQSLNILESSKGSIRGCHQLDPVRGAELAYQGYQQRA